MNEAWKNVAINEIIFAMYVGANEGRAVHTDRPYHGLVLNDDEESKEYVFSDGRVLRTEGKSLFYLPKGSSYCVKSISKKGGCYAINFNADISDVPFALTLRNPSELRKGFHEAARQWKIGGSTKNATAMRALYDAIAQLIKESERGYLPSERSSILAPALSRMECDFTERELSVEMLASLCGVSEVYFRRVFQKRFGVSPKEYLIERRMKYARDLLATGQFGVGEIAEMCGYAEPCHFSREFSKRVGVSPSDYFEKTKKQNS